jgi:hypothetical protein
VSRIFRRNEKGFVIAYGKAKSKFVKDEIYNERGHNLANTIYRARFYPIIKQKEMKELVDWWNARGGSYSIVLCERMIRLETEEMVG